MDNTQNPTNPTLNMQADPAAVPAPAPAMDQSMPAMPVMPSTPTIDPALVQPVADLTQMAQSAPMPMSAIPAMDEMPAAHLVPTGPVSNEQIMDSLHRIEQKLDEMDEKL